MEQAENEAMESFDNLFHENSYSSGHINPVFSNDDGSSVYSASSYLGASNASENQAIRRSDYEEIKVEPLTREDIPQMEAANSLRRRAKSKVTEKFLDDAPSETFSKKKGGFITAGIMSYGTIRRIQMASHEAYDGFASDLYRRIVSNDVGDEGFDKTLLRGLPVNMTIKKKVIERAKSNSETNPPDQLLQSENIGFFAFWKLKLGIKWKHFKEETYRYFSSGGLWRNHFRVIEGHFGTGVLAYFTFLRGIFLLSILSFLLSFAFITVPQVLDPPPTPDCSLTGVGLLTGANCLTNSIMYQGYYTNGTIHELKNLYYHMPLAYLLTSVGYFLFCLIWLVRVTGSQLAKNHQDSTKGFHTNIQVFCAWNFRIMSGDTAFLRHKTILTKLREILQEGKRKSEHRKVCEKLELIILRAISWSTYFALLGGSIALVYYINKTLVCNVIDQTQGNEVLRDLFVPVVVSAINVILPYVNDWLTILEQYKYPRHRLYISVMRNFVFKMSIVGLICAFSTPSGLNSCKNTANTAMCWETYFGQEIYRLVIMDFIFSLIVSTFCAEYLRSFISKPEFSVANNVMDLIYGQTLCWVGVYFSPILPLINTLKYFILFYVKKVSLMMNCRLATETWRASKSQIVFNTLQLVSFLLSASFLTYVLLVETPSESCGPFQGQNNSYDVVTGRIYAVPALATILGLVLNVWVLDGVLIYILILIVFEKNTRDGMKKLAKNLEMQISNVREENLFHRKEIKKRIELIENERLYRQDYDNGPGALEITIRPESKDILMTDVVYDNYERDREIWAGQNLKDEYANKQREKEERDEDEYSDHSDSSSDNSATSSDEVAPEPIYSTVQKRKPVNPAEVYQARPNGSSGYYAGLDGDHRGANADISTNRNPFPRKFEDDPTPPEQDFIMAQATGRNSDISEAAHYDDFLF